MSVILPQPMVAYENANLSLWKFAVRSRKMCIVSRAKPDVIA